MSSFILPASAIHLNKDFGPKKKKGSLSEIVNSPHPSWYRLNVPSLQVERRQIQISQLKEDQKFLEMVMGTRKATNIELAVAKEALSKDELVNKYCKGKLSDCSLKLWLRDVVAQIESLQKELDLAIQYKEKYGTEALPVIAKELSLIERDLPIKTAWNVHKNPVKKTEVLSRNEFVEFAKYDWTSQVNFPDFGGNYEKELSFKTQVLKNFLENFDGKALVALELSFVPWAFEFPQEYYFFEDFMGSQDSEDGSFNSGDEGIIAYKKWKEVSGKSFPQGLIRIPTASRDLSDYIAFDKRLRELDPVHNPIVEDYKKYTLPGFFDRMCYKIPEEGASSREVLKIAEFLNHVSYSPSSAQRGNLAAVLRGQELPQGVFNRFLPESTQGNSK